MADLEAVDYITGQIDRHPGNFFIEPKSGKVTGIDNDLAFPEIDRAEMLERNPDLASKVNPNMPHMMHRETADRIMATSPEALRSTLETVQDPHGRGRLNKAQIDGAVKRLGELQAAIRNPNSVPSGFKIVDKFDKDTYKEALDRQTAKHVASSYLGAMKEERAFIAKNAPNPAYKSGFRDPKTVTPPKRNEQYAEYASQLEHAKRVLKANPAAIQDPATRTNVQDLQKQISETKAKIGEYDKRLDKLGHPTAGDRLRALRYGGVDGSKDAFADKRIDAKQRLVSLEKQLDQAVENSISVELKQGLHEDAGKVVAKKQQQPQAQVQGLDPPQAVVAGNHNAADLQPSDSQPKLERETSVRDMMKAAGSVKNNPFMKQDQELRAAEKEKINGKEKPALERRNSLRNSGDYTPQPKPDPAKQGFKADVG